MYNNEVALDLREPTSPQGGTPVDENLVKTLEAAIPADADERHKLWVISLLLLMILRMAQFGYFTPLLRRLAKAFVKEVGAGMIPLEYGEIYDSFIGEPD